MGSSQAAESPDTALNRQPATRASLQGYSRSAFQERLQRFGRQDAEEVAAAEAVARCAKGTPPKPKHEVQEYSFRTGSFFGSKLNVRSSIPRLAAEDYVRGKFPKQHFRPAEPPAQPEQQQPSPPGQLTPSPLHTATEPNKEPVVPSPPRTLQAAPAGHTPQRCNTAAAQRHADAEAAVAPAAASDLPNTAMQQPPRAPADLAASDASSSAADFDTDSGTALPGTATPAVTQAAPAVHAAATAAPVPLLTPAQAPAERERVQHSDAAVASRPATRQPPSPHVNSASSASSTASAAGSAARPRRSARPPAHSTFNALSIQRHPGGGPKHAAAEAVRPASQVRPASEAASAPAAQRLQAAAERACGGAQSCGALGATDSGAGEAQVAGYLRQRFSPAPRPHTSLLDGLQARSSIPAAAADGPPFVEVTNMVSPAAPVPDSLPAAMAEAAEAGLSAAADHCNSSRASGSTVSARSPQAGEYTIDSSDSSMWAGQPGGGSTSRQGVEGRLRSHVITGSQSNSAQHCGSDCGRCSAASSAAACPAAQHAVVELPAPPAAWTPRSSVRQPAALASQRSGSGRSSISHSAGKVRLPHSSRSMHTAVALAPSTAGGQHPVGQPQPSGSSRSSSSSDGGSNGSRKQPADQTPRRQTGPAALPPAPAGSSSRQQTQPSSQHRTAAARASAESSNSKAQAQQATPARQVRPPQHSTEPAPGSSRAPPLVAGLASGHPAAHAADAAFSTADSETAAACRPAAAARGRVQCHSNVEQQFDPKPSAPGDFGSPPHSTPRKPQSMTAAAARTPARSQVAGQAAAAQRFVSQSPSQHVQRRPPAAVAGYAAIAAARQQQAAAAAAEAAARAGADMAAAAPSQASPPSSSELSYTLSPLPAEPPAIVSAAGLHFGGTSDTGRGTRSPAKGHSNALQLLATCGVDAKIAAAAASASNPIVGVITRVYTPPAGSSPMSSPQRTRSEPSASLLQMMDAAHRDAATTPQNDCAGSRGGGGDGSTRGRGHGAAVQDGSNGGGGGGGAGKASADGNAGAAGNAGVSATNDHSGGGGGAPSWLANPRLNPFEHVANDRWDISSRTTTSGTTGEPLLPVGWLTLPLRAVAGMGTTVGPLGCSRRSSLLLQAGPWGTMWPALFAEMNSKYGPPTLGRRSPLTLAEAAVAASGRRPSYLDDSAAGLDLPVELRSQLRETMRATASGSHAAASKSTPPRRPRPVGDKDAVRSSGCCFCCIRKPR